MDALLSVESYRLSWLSVPFLVASAAALLLSLYVALMRGAPMLRFSFMLICVALLPFVAGYALVGATDSPEVAAVVYRYVSLPLLPLGSAGVLMFLLALSRQLTRHRLLVAAALVSALAAAAVTVATDRVISDEIWKTPAGLWYFRAGDLAWVRSIPMGLWIIVGVVLGWRQLRRETSPQRRKQLRQSVVAFGICALGLVDVPLGYGAGWYPVSWLFLTAGIVVALRSLLVDDLIHARSFDRRAPLALLYVAVAAGAAWLVARTLGDEVSAVALTAALVGVFLALRAATAVLQAVGWRERTVSAADSVLARALEQHATRVQRARQVSEIGAATTEVVRLGLGCQDAAMIVPAAGDYSWETSDGDKLPEEATPDPLLLTWLGAHDAILHADELETLRLGDLRAPLERMLAAHQAETVVPLVNRDELVGLLVLGTLESQRALRTEEVGFLTGLAEQVTAALVYVSMSDQATARVEVDKEVELAAAVQRAFVPPSDDLFVCGPVTVSGLYTPASRCGGDWWSVHRLADGRVLVLIGDVTGHGVAAALVTAAAKGCYDIAQRLMDRELDLVRLLELLDAAVRRTGAGRFHMTCFATLIDPAAGVVHYANAGHAMPYLCRRRADGDVSLEVLAARGNPLGAGDRPSYGVERRALGEGDVLVWYTDGIVEATNAAQQPFGDRRFQRTLRKLAADTGDVQLIRDQLARTAMAFLQGESPDDDITLVVGRVG